MGRGWVFQTPAITAHGNHLRRLSHTAACPVTGREQHLLTQFLAPPLIPLHLETAKDKWLSSPTQSTGSGGPCYTLHAEDLTRPRQAAVPAKLPMPGERECAKGNESLAWGLQRATDETLALFRGVNRLEPASWSTCSFNLTGIHSQYTLQILTPWS